MTTTPTTRRPSLLTPRGLIAALATTAIAGIAAAQPPATQPPKDETQLLRGPAVTDTNVPGASNAFAGRPMAGASNARPDERPILMRAFVAGIRQLDQPGVDPALRLNDGQRAVIEVMLREHRQAVELWRTEHQDEIRELRGSFRQGDKPRGRRGASSPARGERSPKAGQPQDRRFRQGDPAERLDTSAAPRGQRQDATRGARNGQRANRDAAQANRKNNNQRNTRPNDQRKTQLKALMATRPSPEPQQAQIWNTLTPEQQSFVESSLERRKTDAIARRDALKQRRKNGVSDQANPNANPNTRGQRSNRPAIRDGETPKQFRQRMIRHIEKLPADQRERALDRTNRKTKKHGAKNKRSR